MNNLFLFFMKCFFKVFKVNRILCLHSISNVGMSSECFIKLIDSLEYVGFEFCSLRDLDGIGNKIAITFDDGYEDNYTVAFKYLKKKNINAVVFVVTDFLLGRVENNQANGLKDLPCLSFLQIKELIENGWDVGFHTKSHMNLYENNWDDIITDFKSGHDEFIKIVGKSKGLIFAYPYGNLPIKRHEFEALLLMYNYQYAYTTRWGGDANQAHYINRVVIGDNDKTLWSILKISGLIDWYGRIKWKGERFV